MEEDFIVRRPRHDACPETDLRLTITDPATGVVREGGLSDLSRQGLKAITDGALVSGAVVYVLAEVPQTALHVSSPATVRWSRLQDDGRWASGLVFQKELSWETMGELFLHGVLSAAAAHSSSVPRTV